MREDVMSVRRKHLSSIGYDNEQHFLLPLFFLSNSCVSSYQAIVIISFKSIRPYIDFFLFLWKKNFMDIYEDPVEKKEAKNHAEAEKKMVEPVFVDFSSISNKNNINNNVYHSLLDARQTNE